MLDDGGRAETHRTEAQVLLTVGLSDPKLNINFEHYLFLLSLTCVLVKYSWSPIPVGSASADSSHLRWEARYSQDTKPADTEDWLRIWRFHKGMTCVSTDLVSTGEEGHPGTSLPWIPRDDCVCSLTKEGKGLQKAVSHPSLYLQARFTRRVTAMTWCDEWQTCSQHKPTSI